MTMTQANGRGSGNAPRAWDLGQAGRAPCVELLNHAWRKVGGSLQVDRCAACGLNILRGDPLVHVGRNVLHTECAATRR